MQYLKEYQSNIESSKRNFVSQFILDKINKKYLLAGQKSYKAIFFDRVLKISNIDLKDTEISVLEIGGGGGDYMMFNHQNISRKIMIDIDNYYEEYFKSLNIEFYMHDISKQKISEIKDGVIDLVMLNHVIEHIQNLDFFMTELKRIMKTESKIYIRTPDIKKVKFSFYDDITHIRPFSSNGLRHLMGIYGFREHILLNSNSNTIKLEHFFGLKPGSLKFLFPKEIEAVYIKK